MALKDSSYSTTSRANPIRLSSLKGKENKSRASTCHVCSAASLPQHPVPGAAPSLAV